MKYFYSHIIEIDALVIELDSMNLSKDEKQNLAKLIDANVHNHVLDVVLSELSEEDKQLFLKYLNLDDHEKSWEYLQSKIDKVEGKIKKTVEDLKVEMNRDIRESKKLNLQK